MKMVLLIAMLGFVFTNSLSANAATQCPAHGDTSVEQLAENWILIGWEKKLGDGPLEFRQKLGGYYEWSDSTDRIYYDDFDPKRRVVRDPASYGAIWEPAFSSLRTAKHALSLAATAIYSDKLAISTLEFVARLEDNSGKITAIRTLSTLTWRCTDEGWRIAREHNSSAIVPESSIAPLFKKKDNG